MLTQYEAREQLRLGKPVPVKRLKYGGNTSQPNA
jgi:hypothetical protein